MGPVRAVGNSFKRNEAVVQDIINSLRKRYATAAGFEPARAKPIQLAAERLNHSAKLSFSGKGLYVDINGTDTVIVSDDGPLWIQ